MTAVKDKILLVGGGTMGSVSPLLAIAQSYEADYVFVGTKNGPERAVVKVLSIPYTYILSAKWRRYFSLQNFWDLFKFIGAFFQSLYLIARIRPKLILTAGSFVATPVAWAAWFWRCPLIVHQQDIETGLANRLMAPLATKISVVFPDLAKNFSPDKVVVTGNPVRAIKEHKSTKPRVLITGGGLGARGLNSFVSQFIPNILKTHEVHHVLGDKNWDQRLDLPDYFPYRFVTSQMPELLASADLIISRAGMSLISEAASLKKALILIPISDSHQEKNAAYLAGHNAVYVVKQGSTHVMKRYLSKLLTDAKLRSELGQNLYQLFPSDANLKYQQLIKEIIRK